MAILEPGDKVLIPAYGRFAYLLAEIATRIGADVTLMEKEWDSPFDPQEIIDKLKEVKPKLLAMVHGETANGQSQPLEELGAYCQANDVLLMADMVPTLGGVPVKVKEWGVDIAVSGSQKCISVPAGLSLVTFGPRIEKILDERYQTELGNQMDRPFNDRHIVSNYLDLSQLRSYWSDNPVNHHTEATTLIYGLHTGLRVILEEGLDNVFARHDQNDRAIKAGIKAMGLGIYGNEETKMATVTPVLVPEGIKVKDVQDFLLHQFGVEVAGSFGPLIGKVFRIGNMGYSSRKENVLQLLGAIEATMIHLGADVEPGRAVAAALEVYLEK